MARSHGRVSTRLWTRDEDFRALSLPAQWLYLFLLAQPDLSHAGLIPMRLRRWAGAAAGLTVSDVAAAVEELSQARFVLVDHDTEDLLVRTLMRNDGVARQPNVFKAAVEQIREITSPALRAAIATELVRIDNEDTHPEVRALITDLLPTLGEGSATPSGNPSAPPSGGVAAPLPSTIPVQTCGDKYGEQVTTASPSPHVPSPPAATRAPARDDARPVPDEITKICEHLADRIAANGSKRPTITKRWLDAASRMIEVDGRLPADIHAAIEWSQDHEFWRANILSMPKLRQKYDQMRLQAERGRNPGQPSSRSTTDERVRQAHEAGRSLAAKIATQHNQQTRGELT
ncbi:hypothetical protein [Planobispora takensis]|uniref:Uncharacterized protein n=1 Tax=Planobispora takensis TaxID=1367882 RepID=A0A8J3SPV1_9ACTN|nr:hypothetical protein [Planobispora takensis]GIH98107.1 hypothetical protein Pta02_01160 [Planobispora takensis]